MNVVIAFSKKYYESGCIAVFSLFSNNRDIDDLNLYLISQDFDESDFKRLVTIANAFEREIVFVDSSLFESFMSNKHIQMWYGSYISYSKLFCAKLFPSLNKLIILDADVFVNRSLKQLWDCDMSGITLMAARDTTKGYSFNAGVLLVNLERWRQKNYDNEIENLLLNSKTKFVEQDIFNKLFASGDDYSFFSQFYNFVPSYLSIGYSKYIKRFKDENISEDQYCDWENNVKIIHYNFVGKAAPFIQHDEITKRKWSQTYEKVFLNSPTLPNLPNPAFRKIGHCLRFLLPQNLYTKIKFFFYRKKRK